MSSRLVIAPVEGWVDHNRARHVRRTVAIVEREVFVGIADLIAKQRVILLDPAIGRLDIGFDQQLRRVEAQAILSQVYGIALND